MLLFQPHTLLLSWIVNVPNECYLLSLKVVQTVLCINPKAPTSIYKFSRLILHCLIEVVERICLKIKAFSWRFSFHPSSETQGQSVGSGEKARRKFSSTSGRAPGYRLSPDHFQTVKRMQAPDCGTRNALYYCAQWANSISWVLFVSWYTTAIPGSPKMHFIKKTSWCWSVDEN